MCLFTGSVYAITGSGTESDPYIISTSEDIVALSGNGLGSYNVSGYYELANDIDMSSVSNFVPIGTSAYSFSGNFNGKNHIVNNLKISGYLAAMFYMLSSNACIHDITLNKARVLGTYMGACLYYRTSVGATNVVIYNVTINNSYIEGNAYDTGAIASNVAYTNSTVKMSYCTVKNCVVLCTGSNAGALGGYSSWNGGQLNCSNCNVENSYVLGKTMGGGLFGFALYGSTIISECKVNNSTIIGGEHAGGLSARAQLNTFTTNCKVFNCSIIGKAISGGIFGRCY